MIHHADCLTAMAGMEPESVDAVVTDPPYGINFMGRAWDNAAIMAATKRNAAIKKPRTDGRKVPIDQAASFAGAYDFSLKGNRAFQEWSYGWAEAAYRVAKPSAYLLAFGGTRTVHRMTVALEDAGWIIRDMLVWAYASGFPKSKASLKPAWEPIVMARKPGPLRMLAIDECRIPLPEGDAEFIASRVGTYHDRPGPAAINVHRNGEPSADRRYPDGTFAATPGPRGGDPLGRWPANVILTDPIFDGGWDGVVGGGETHSQDPATRANTRHASFGAVAEMENPGGYGDSGTYSRFFLIPKADRADREPVLGGLPEKAIELRLTDKVTAADWGNPDAKVYERNTRRQNVHPTVKPVDLMRHLVRLVTPTGGTVLDPFLGSGTTAIAAEMEGFAWIGIEKEAEYVAIAEARLNGTQRGLGLPA